MHSERCPTREELLAYNLGRVSPEDQVAISEHLQDCEACLNALAELDGENDALLSAVTRVSMQPLLAEMGVDQEVFAHGLTRTMALAGTARSGQLESEFEGVLLESGREKLGQYELLEELGRGGMGIVYRARHESLQKIVALKILYGSRLDSADAVERFQREMKAVGKLSHPCVVRATDAGFVDGAHYLAMEYVPGENLSRMLREDKYLSARESAELVRDVAWGLQHAHHCGLVHRDVKPSNILIDKKGRARITDFGLVLTGNDPADDLAYAGTPAYMSPEQARGEGHRVDGRSDIFSLGAVFYRLLTGQQPFAGPGVRQLCEKIATANPPAPRSLDPGVPGELELVCMKALAKEPAKRYATAGEMADDLEAWLQRQDRQDRVGDVPSSGFLQFEPKGLRAFGAADAEFFLDLLPGHRDRSGLPDAVRFWKRRIEETDAEKSFRIGVLRGPHGCGKTSLVLAGLLPNLAEHVTPVYVVATGRHTEPGVAARLRDLFPAMAGDLHPATALAQARSELAEHPDAKVVLVIDQFEQWLCANRNFDDSALAKALGECDGQRIQCLLVVRDELWNSTESFLQAIGISLDSDTNCRSVDLLDPDLARSVLAAYGHACGALPSRVGDQTASHIQFLDEAIGELVEGGGVSPLPLTMFAETFKDRLWAPGTLHQMGEFSGVGASFLKSAFQSSSSEGKQRAHRHAARAVLAELCPELGVPAVRHARSHQRLLEVSGYAESPKRFDELLSILNHRLRLISFVDPRDSGEDDSSPRDDSQSYRLSHDYLVPIIHAWTTVRREQTRRRRAWRCLEDCAAGWNAQPQRRNLPSLSQWIRISLFTPRRSWSASQHKMMWAATRLHATRLGIAALAGIAAALAVAGWVF